MAFSNKDEPPCIDIVIFTIWNELLSASLILRHGRQVIRCSEEVFGSEVIIPGKDQGNHKSQTQHNQYRTSTTNRGYEFHQELPAVFLLLTRPT